MTRKAWVTVRLPGARTAPATSTRTRCQTNSGAPIARLRPTGRDDRFEVLYWSLGKQKCAGTGPFGRTDLSLDAAFQFIAHEDIFWVMT